MNAMPPNPDPLILDQQQGDRRTKQSIVFTLCGIAWAFSFTVCFLAMKQLPIPDALDRMATFILGNITGILAKTAGDKILGPEPIPITNPPGKALKTEDISPEPEPEPKVPKP